MLEMVVMVEMVVVDVGVVLQIADVGSCGGGQVFAFSVCAECTVRLWWWHQGRGLWSGVVEVVAVPGKVVGAS